MSDNQYSIQCQKSYEMVNVLSLIDRIIVFENSVFGIKDYYMNSHYNNSKELQHNTKEINDYPIRDEIEAINIFPTSDGIIDETDTDYSNFMLKKSEILKEKKYKADLRLKEEEIEIYKNKVKKLKEIIEDLSRKPVIIKEDFDIN